MERQPSEFASPVLGEVKVEAGFDAVHFDVQVRGAWSECGVYFGESASALRRIPGERTGQGFSVDVTDLEDEAVYYWQAFVDNGRDEVLSRQEQVVTQVSPYLKIPDPAFRAWVLAHYDVDGDGRISQQEARLIIDICSYEGTGARSLRGIECFPNLRTLIWANDSVLEIDLSANGRLEEINLENNLLTALDLSGCPRLEYLSCNDNKLSELDLSSCPRLKQVSCWNNLLTALDVSGLPELEILCCAQSDFSDSGLDVSANPKLRLLWCNETRLKELNVSSNPLLEELGCYGNPLEDMLDLTANPRLDTLDVKDCPGLQEVWLKTGQTIKRGIVKDGHTEICYTASTPLLRNLDAGFKDYLVSRYDRDGDGEISRKEARGIREIGVCSDEWNIRSLKGIEHMPNLEILNCTGSWIDGPVPDQPYYFQGPYRWDGIFGPAGTLREVDVSRNPNLVELALYNNAGLGLSIGTLDLHANPLLEVLELGMTDLEYPDVSFLTDLRVLNLSHLHGTKPDISKLDKLTFFALDFPQDDRTGYAVDVSHCPDLEELHIATAGSVSDLSKNPKMRNLSLDYMGLTSLDVSIFPHLVDLSCRGNQIAELDLSANPQLWRLECRDNLLRTLDVSENPSLYEFWASPMSDPYGNNLLESLYVAKGQEIPYVTKDRSVEHLPAQTKIVTK